MRLFDEPGDEPDWSAAEVGEAHFSADRVYRYALSRVWDGHRPVGLIVGLNPSTADENRLDNTLRRCIRFGHREGWGGFWMANLFAVRATDPSDMKNHPAPIGEPLRVGPIAGLFEGARNVNDTWIVDLANVVTAIGGGIICAWGSHGGHLDRDRHVLKLLKRFELTCFGTTAGGHPKHPLYLHSDTHLIPYTGRPR